jgi:G patch domain-containing protein 1
VGQLCQTTSKCVEPVCDSSTSLTQPWESPLASTIAEALLPPSSESGGATLLRKMGWRPGQGVGPRVTYDQLRKQDLQSSEPPVSSGTSEMDEDDEARMHTFAPRDTRVTVFRPKENHFGLGYMPGATLSEAINHGETTGPKISCEFDQIHYCASLSLELRSWFWSWGAQ